MDDVEAIKQLKAPILAPHRFKGVGGYRTCSTDDVITDTHSGDVVMTGVDAFRTAMTGDVLTVYQCHAPEIQITSAAEATGIWAVEDMARFPDGLDLAMTFPPP